MFYVMKFPECFFKIPPAPITTIKRVIQISKNFEIGSQAMKQNK